VICEVVIVKILLQAKTRVLEEALDIFDELWEFLLGVVEG